MKKVLRCFLLITLFSTSVHSLTNGPAQPEYSGFTPSNLEGMVDLFTGDFTYSIPLMDVPGPTLCYPLTLGYRGGVQLEQEASWVGLGWCLNVGSINRSVNRYPDDYVKGRSESLLKGNKAVSGWDASIGISVANVGLSVNFGERSDQGWHFGLDLPTGLSSFNIASFNERDGWESKGLAEMGINLSSPISLAKGGASVSMGGASFGFGSTTTHVGAFHSSSKGFSLGFKIGNYISVSAGYRKYKYWIHKTERDDLFGYLYLGDNSFNKSNLNNKLEYSFAPEISRRELTGYNDILSMFETLKAFAVSTPDGFNATAEGMSTCFRAYRQDIGDYFGMDRHESEVPEWLAWVDSKWWSSLFQSWIDDKIEDRLNDLNKRVTTNATLFVNDTSMYSNYFYNDYFRFYGTGKTGDHLPVIAFRQTGDPGGAFIGEGWRPPDEEYNGSINNALYYRKRINRISDDTSAVHYFKPFIPSLVDGEKKYIDNIEGLQNVEPLKNRISGSTGIFPVFASSEGEGILPAKALKGFILIRPDGMRYEYTKPVLNFFNKVYSVKRPDKEKERNYDHLDFGGLTNSTTMERAYAYSFLLEAVKGPDYVDCDGDGQVSDGDIGSWVRFEYNSHIPYYHYRTPYEGVAPVGVSRDQKISKSEYHCYGQASWGTKEIYYLTDIYTPTHQVHVTLSNRNDGKEAEVEARDGIELIGEYSTNEVTLKSSGYVLATGDTCKISYIRKELYDTVCYDDTINNVTAIIVNCTEDSTDYTLDNGTMMSRRYYLQKTDGTNLAIGSIYCDSAGATQCTLDVIGMEIKRNIDNSRLQKIDRIDLYKRISEYVNDSIPVKSILFQYEDSTAKQLCPGIPNTYDTINNPGKLTLRKLTFRFNDKINLPSYQFNYYKEGNEAPYHFEHWDRWGYYKSDGGLIPVKLARRNIALWQDMIDIIQNIDSNNVRGDILRDTLQVLLSNSDMSELQMLDSAKNLKPRHKDAIGEALDRIKNDLNFYNNYYSNANLVDTIDKKSSGGDLIYEKCMEIYDALTKGTNPVMDNTGNILKSDLEDWEINRIYALNMALLSEMIYIKDYQPSEPVENEQRIVMKHLDINRFDHEPNKDDVDAWSLKQVIMPSGAKLKIEYESDDFTYVGRTRAVVPNEMQKIDEKITNEDLSDLSFYRYVGIEKDLLTKNNLLRINGYHGDSNLDALEQDGTRALNKLKIRISSLFRVWRKIDGQWQMNEDFKKLKQWKDEGKTDEKYKLHLIALLDPVVFSTWMVNTTCQECGVQNGKTDDDIEGTSYGLIPIDLGPVIQEFNLDSVGDNGEYACQWNEVVFKMGDLEDSTRWEQRMIWADGTHAGKCIVHYFAGIFESVSDCNHADLTLEFPGEDQFNYQYSLTWGRRVDFTDDDDVEQNISSKMMGIRNNGEYLHLEKFEDQNGNYVDLHTAAKWGTMENCYIDTVIGTHKGFFSWSYFTEYSANAPYETPPQPGITPEFLKSYWDFYSIITHLKLEDPEVSGFVPGIVGGGIRVKRLNYLSGWPVRTGQPPLTRTVEYQYVCEAVNGRPGNYSSGATASMPPPYNNQGDDRADVPPQISLVQGAPKVTYGTVHEVRPGRGRIIHKFLTSADVGDYFADDSLNYYKFNEYGNLQVLYGAYNADPTLAGSFLSSHHRWLLHRCSGMQGLMYRQSKFSEDGRLVNEKKIKYITSLTKNDICNLDLIGKMNYVDSKLSEVLIPMENEVAAAGTSDSLFKINPLSEEMGVTKERLRLRWLYDSYTKDTEPDNKNILIGLNDVEIIEHSVHQYSVQTTTDGVGTSNINSYFDFLTGEPIVSTVTEAVHNESKICNCYDEADTVSEEEVVTVDGKTTVTIPAYWIEQYRNNTENPMAPICKDKYYRRAMMGIKPFDSLINNNMLNQKYSVSVYSDLEPYPVCCESEQDKWILKLSDILEPEDSTNSALFKRTVTTWNLFTGAKPVWRKENEIELRANMTGDKRIDAEPSQIGLPYEDPSFFKGQGLYVSISENTKYDNWGRTIEIKDANDNYAASFYDIQNIIRDSSGGSQYPSLYLTAKVMNSKKDNSAVLTVDEMIDNEGNLIFPNGWSLTGAVTIDTTYKRSGSKSLKLQTGGNVKLQMVNAEYDMPYILSFWIKGAGSNQIVVNINTCSDTVNYNTGKKEWQRYYKEVNTDSYPDITIQCCNGTAYVDDIRFAPKKAHVYSMTYDRMGQITSYSGPDDKIRTYSYDDYGRLIEIRDHQGVLISTQAQLLPE